MSRRLAVFMDGVAIGLSDYDAAIRAGYSRWTARNTRHRLWNQKRAEDLYAVSLQRAARNKIPDVESRVRNKRRK